MRTFSRSKLSTDIFFPCSSLGKMGSERCELSSSLLELGQQLPMPNPEETDYLFNEYLEELVLTNTYELDERSFRAIITLQFRVSLLY